MSEPWAFPQKPSDNDPEAQPAGTPPERVSVNDSVPSNDSVPDTGPPGGQIPQQTEQFAPQEPGPQEQVAPQQAPPEQFPQEQLPQATPSSDTNQFAQAPTSPPPVQYQQTEQFPQQEQFQQTEPYAQQEQFHQQQYQYQEPVQPPAQYYDAMAQPQQQPVPKKKSGLLGLIGMLMVLVGNIVLAIAISVNFSQFELNEAFFESLTRAQFGAGLFFVVSAGLWILGSLLCLIAVAARRGVIAGVIGLFIVLVPSWFMAMILIFAAMGSTALLYLVN